MILVVPTLTVNLEAVVRFVDVGLDMLEILLSIALWNLVVRILVEPMLSAKAKVDRLFASVPEVMLEILIPTVSKILVLPILVVPMLFAKTMAMLPFANVPLTMLVIPMFPAHSILVPKTPVDPIPNVTSVDKDQFVDVSEDSLENPLVGLDVALILVQSMIFAVPMLNAEMKGVDLSANACLVTKVILTLVV